MTKSGDALLANIERLLKGRPAAAQEQSLNQWQEDIKDAEAFIGKNLGEDLRKYGSWTLSEYPTVYDPKRIKDPKGILDLISKSEVNLRGWNFPHTDSHGKATNLARGRQSYTIWDRYSEAYRAYQSGLFVLSRVFWEDKEGHSSEGRPVLSFVNAIWSLTEHLLFVKRYYEEICPDGTIHVEIKLRGTDGRVLVSLQPMVPFFETDVSREDPIILQEDTQVVTVRASFKEIAGDLARRLFAMFNWNDPDPRMIDNWQTKLLERRL